MGEYFLFHEVTSSYFYNHVQSSFMCVVSSFNFCPIAHVLGRCHKLPRNNSRGELLEFLGGDMLLRPWNPKPTPETVVQLKFATLY